MRSILSVFFLASFLFPQVLKEVHSEHHREQVACDARTAHHFHEHHDECGFCDLIQPFTAEPSKVNATIGSFHFAENLFHSHAEVFSPSFHFSSAPLRAPPALS